VEDKRKLLSAVLIREQADNEFVVRVSPGVRRELVWSILSGVARIVCLEVIFHTFPMITAVLLTIYLLWGLSFILALGFAAVVSADNALYDSYFGKN
jgi:hypothetical protein